MRLIHFQGLNCFHDCVISVANNLGINFADAFCTLWSETDFRYDKYRQVYLTKRMITNFEALGVKVECFDCFSYGDVSDKLLLFQEGDFLIVGMDAFNIPWNQFYQKFHGPHYFIILNEKAERLLCFDPTYNKENETISSEEIINHTFDICCISQVAQLPFRADINAEAVEIIRTHPNTCDVLSERIRHVANEDRESVMLLSKYIDAMICNRYLYRHFLNNGTVPFVSKQSFLTDDQFAKWKAVKNGLYKAFVSRGREDIISDICNHLKNVMDAEIIIAENIIAGECYNAGRG